jgi:hypothetical protein
MVRKEEINRYKIVIIFFLSRIVSMSNVRNELKSVELKELRIRKWTGFVMITKMEFGDNFGRMSKFISQNP